MYFFNVYKYKNTIYIISKCSAYLVITVKNPPSYLFHMLHSQSCQHVFSMFVFEIEQYFLQGGSRIFSSTCGMKEFMPSTNYPWSDFTHLLISWFYSHFNVAFLAERPNFVASFERVPPAPPHFSGWIYIN